MQTYEVIWRIEVDAETPLEAAMLARKLQGEDSEALVFETRDEAEHRVDIDLLAYI